MRQKACQHRAKEGSKDARELLHARWCLWFSLIIIMEPAREYPMEGTNYMVLGNKM